MITAAQRKDLQDKVAKLVADKGDADGKANATINLAHFAALRFRTVGRFLGDRL